MNAVERPVGVSSAIPSLRLRRLEALLRQYFVIDDWQGVELILAAAVAHYVPGEMLWFRIIGPSRSGKTEMLRALAEHKDCAKMEFLTPAALRGGFRESPKVLNRIDGKLVITKDLATLLTTRNDLRVEIFGLLRPIKDGELISDFGSDEGNLIQRATFDWILATTPVFEQSRQLESLLGERFIDLRWRPGDRQQMAFRAGMNNPSLKHIRPELASAVKSLMDDAREGPNIELLPIHVQLISESGDKAARLRTPVPRDRERDLTTYPEPEIGTDLTQGFCRIAQGLMRLGITRWGPYINRLVWDCMPRMRIEVVSQLVGGTTNVEQISKATNLSPRAVRYVLEDLKLLGVIDHNNALCMQLHI